jgi:hypothetical protein
MQNSRKQIQANFEKIKIFNITNKKNMFLSSDFITKLVCLIHDIRTHVLAVLLSRLRAHNNKKYACQPMCFKVIFKTY